MTPQIKRTVTPCIANANSNSNNILWVFFPPILFIFSNYFKLS